MWQKFFFHGLTNTMSRLLKIIKNPHIHLSAFKMNLLFLSDIGCFREMMTWCAYYSCWRPLRHWQRHSWNPGQFGSRGQSRRQTAETCRYGPFLFPSSSWETAFSQTSAAFHPLTRCLSRTPQWSGWSWTWKRGWTSLRFWPATCPTADRDPRRCHAETLGADRQLGCSHTATRWLIHLLFLSVGHPGVARWTVKSTLM